MNPKLLLLNPEIGLPASDGVDVFSACLATPV
jgi:hypothetical protein